MNIYIANLAENITEDDLKKAFEAFGPVTSVNVIKDKYTNKSRGFAFVEMDSDKDGQAAIDGLNGKDLKGSTLTVNEARPRKERHGGGRR